MPYYQHGVFTTSGVKVSPEASFCPRLDSTSTHQVHNAPKVSVPTLLYLSMMMLPSLFREPFSRLLSQYRHDKYYTPRVFKDCDSLDVLVQPGAACIQSREPAYRYQNFQAMMLGGCIWNHKTAVCEQVKHPAYKGGGFVTPREILAGYHFVGINEYFEGTAFFKNLITHTNQ